MDKRRLSTTVIAISVAAIFTVILPQTQTKANHCHPIHTQIPKVNSNNSIGNRSSSSEKKSHSTSSTRAFNLERQRTNTKTSRFKTKPIDNETSSLNMIYTREIPIAMLSIDKAAKTIESGDKETVLAELDKALKKLITIYEILGTHVKPQFANSHCPIMGSSVDTKTVPKSLTRYYKGQNVAFCCSECPSTWDKLTYTQKQVKLSQIEK